MKIKATLDDTGRLLCDPCTVAGHSCDLNDPDSINCPEGGCAGCDRVCGYYE